MYMQISCRMSSGSPLTNLKEAAGRTIYVIPSSNMSNGSLLCSVVLLCVSWISLLKRTFRGRRNVRYYALRYLFQGEKAVKIGEGTFANVYKGECVRVVNIGNMQALKERQVAKVAHTSSFKFS